MVNIRCKLSQLQRGSATLLVSLLILVGATLIVVSSARTSFMEQRISANEIRTKQASNAAQAGLEQALAYLVGGGRDPTSQFNASLGDNSSYMTVFWDNGTPPTLAPNNLCTNAPGVPAGYTAPAALSVAGPVQPIFLIYSCGWSDDRAARQALLVSSRLMPTVPNPPTVPLIARGAVDTNGRARVFNYFNNLTIWSGGDLSITGNPGNTFIRNPNNSVPPITDPLPEEPPNCAVHETYICTTDMDVIGPDVIAGEHGLNSLSLNEYFENFLGGTRDEIRSNSMMDEDNTVDLDGVTATSIWVEGDFTLDGTIGTRQDPVILIVNGDLTVTGTTQFFGLLYVAGDMDSSGTPHFYGSTIVEGSVEASGTPYYIFDPLALSNIRKLGSMATLPGTWHDWLAAPAP